MRPCSPAALPLCLALVTGAHALRAAADDSPTLPVQPHDTIVVTAAFVQEPIDDTVQHTTVIDETRIRETQAPDVATLLRDQAGIELVQPGGVGKQSSLFMRGTNSNHTLVLIDGVRVSSSTSGATAIDQVPLAAVDHIEIVRGNVSALYGADAVGGVIQIFTRSGAGRAPGLSASVSAGTQDTYSASAAYGGSTETGWRFNLGVSSYDTHGYQAIRSQYIPTPFVTRIEDLSKDPYHQRSANLSVAKELAPGHEIGVNGLYSDAKVFFGGTFGNESLPRLSTLSAHLNDQFTSAWKSSVTLATGTDTLPTLLDGVPVGYARTTDDQAKWRNEIDLGKAGRLTAGLEALTQHLDSDTAYAKTSRHVDSGTLGWLGRFGAHSLQANVRTDRYSDFGNQTSGLAGYGYDFDAHWRASASLSTAFRAPTFIDLYDPLFGNPSVQPEKTRSAEIALQYKQGAHTVRVTGFENRIHDLIQYVAPTFKATNVDEARIEGAELEWIAEWGDTRLSASLTLQDPKNQTTGELLLRRARHFGSVEASRRLGAWRFTLQALASGPRDDIHIAQFNRTQVGGYTVVNAMADYRISARQSVGVRVDNLLDKDYEIVQGYNVQRFAVLATWRYDWD